MRLIVDIGNSRMKSAVDEDGRLTPLETFAWRESFLDDVLARVWLEALGQRVPTAIHVSNVAGDSLLPNLDAWCCRHRRRRPLPMRSEARFAGLVNGYAEPETFGVDRRASMVGGAILPGNCTMRRYMTLETIGNVGDDRRVDTIALAALA